MKRPLSIALLVLSLGSSIPAHPAERFSLTKGCSALLDHIFPWRTWPPLRLYRKYVRDRQSGEVLGRVIDMTLKVPTMTIQTFGPDGLPGEAVTLTEFRHLESVDPETERTLVARHAIAVERAKIPFNVGETTFWTPGIWYERWLRPVILGGGERVLPDSTGTLVDRMQRGHALVLVVREIDVSLKTVTFDGEGWSVTLPWTLIVYHGEEFAAEAPARPLDDRPPLSPGRIEFRRRYLNGLLTTDDYVVLTLVDTPIPFKISRLGPEEFAVENPDFNLSGHHLLDSLSLREDRSQVTAEEFFRTYFEPRGDVGDHVDGSLRRKLAESGIELPFRPGEPTRRQILRDGFLVDEQTNRATFVPLGPTKH